MMHRGNLGVFGACALTGAVLIATGMAGCQAQQTSAGSTSGGGDGGSDATSTVSSTTSTTGGMGGAGGAGSSSGGGGEGTGGSAPACQGQDATVYQVTNQDAEKPPVGGSLGNKVKVSLKGVIAMSRKFLVSKSSAGKCLWGTFVSAPDVGGSTAEYSGIMIVSQGTNATVDPEDGKTYCPKLGVPGDMPGDAIPDDVKPGDVLNVIGMTDYFLLNQCANEMNGSQVAQRQIANVCLAEKTGDTVAPPKAHVLSTEEIVELASSTNKSFHDKWGGVKVRIEGPLPTVEQKNSKGMPSVTNTYGEILLEGSNLVIGDKLYYRGYSTASNKCFAGPAFTLPMSGPFTLDAAEGFGYMNYCTWTLQPNNKCTDFIPASEDCATGGQGGKPLMCD